jgi:predicted AAA+ superfamily ATPase
MEKKNLLKTMIIDSQSRALPKVWARALSLPLESEKIVTLTGVRRSGKTYHLFDLMTKLTARGVPSNQILYINFEDERLHLIGNEMDLILQAYQELYPDIRLSECYFFFDEIQEVEGWEKFIDRLYSSVSSRVFITGSNSKLLSKEIASALRGRTITFEVYPLSFSEFVQVVRPGLNPNSSTDKARLAALFNRFLHEGGFPEIVTQQNELKDRILQEYFSVMLLRDLVERYSVSQVAVLKYFCKRVIGASAGEFSVNKIYNELKSQGYSISKDSLYAYRENVESIYMGRFIAKYSESVVKSEGSLKKVYVIDQGLGAALDFKLGEDNSRLLETTIALELLKQGKQINYYQENVECDFTVSDKNQVVEAMQVTLSVVDNKTRRREIKGLTECCKRFNLTKGTIVTIDDNEVIEVDGIKISIVPAWKYCL